MIYAELIKRLRETSVDFGESDHISVMMIEAANAIEDLITALTASNEVIAKSKPKWIPVTEENDGHDRLMNALAEIKAICSKQEDAEFGCGKRCPFLMGKDGDAFRGCEVMAFTRQDSCDVIDTPEEWGEPPESEGE